MNICGKVSSEVRLEKIRSHQSMKGQFTIKYLIFREILHVVQIFPMLYLNSLSEKIDNQISCFPCAVVTL